MHIPSYIGVGAFYGRTGCLAHGGINFDEAFVKSYLLKLCEQLEEFGFELIILLYGHTIGGNINAHEGYGLIAQETAKIVTEAFGTNFLMNREKRYVHNSYC